MARTRLAPRKKPVQSRSRQMVEDILGGAIRVLRKKGGRRFTTIEVAREAGISVGSLYQYFPNKEALLFALQAAEWEETTKRIWSIALEEKGTPRERLYRMVTAFFRSEAAEADLRRAMEETGLSFEETEAFRALAERNRERMTLFLAELAPATNAAQRRFLASFCLAAMGALGEAATREPRTKAEVDRWAKLAAKMLLAAISAPEV
ncbi:MAG TPA: TetR/AcrR family transcriptional regulator [Candidatus Methylacidiphilales bacterium]